MPRLGLRRQAALDAVRHCRQRAPRVRGRAARQAELGHLTRLGAHLGPANLSHLPLEPAHAQW
uniref:Uncharacterized protein n=1 Tax=Arundo donax TaxID=35708 RepID=A0A0A9A9L5_ARUDO